MQLHIYKDADEVCNALAAWIAALIDKTLKEKKFFTWALSGGETPKKLYQKLSSEPFNKLINWKKVHIFWGDERFVPFDDKDNNAKMTYDNLLNKVEIPAAQIHRMRTNISPENSVSEYEEILHQYFDDKQTTFDLTLLGLGEDGHTLSLFPNSEILNDQQSWVNAVSSKEKGERITLMPCVVNKSSEIIFLVTGENKAKIIQQILEDSQQHSYPAQLIQPSNGKLHWFVDEEAAKYLKK